MRSSTADELVRLDAHRSLSLDEALEWVGDDECVEVTPSTVRVRKLELSATLRAKAARRERVRA
jgi:GTP-binding protein